MSYDPHTIHGQILSQVEAHGAAVLTKPGQSASEQRHIRRVAHELEARGLISLRKSPFEDVRAWLHAPDTDLRIDAHQTADGSNLRAWGAGGPIHRDPKAPRPSRPSE